MSNDLPENLGSEFWFALFMLPLCCSGSYLGFAGDNPTAASVGALLAFFYIHRLVKRLRDVRLARHLKQNPELLRIYNAQNR